MQGQAKPGLQDVAGTACGGVGCCGFSCVCLLFSVSGGDSFARVITEKGSIFPVHITSDNPPTVINPILHGVENRAEVGAGSLKREGRTVTGNKEERIASRPSIFACAELSFQIFSGVFVHSIRRLRGEGLNIPALFFQTLRTKTWSPVGRTPTEKSAIVPHPVVSEPYSFLSSAMMEERYCSTAQT